VTPRVAVYTCITGGYDPIRAPERSEPGVDYWCFTDAPNVPAPWRRQAIPIAGLDSLDQNRYVKMHPHRIEALAGYDLTVYVDGSITIVGDIMELIHAVEAREEELFAYDHWERRCAYEEGLVCAIGGRDWIWRIDRQLARYRAEGFPAQYGLFEGGVLVRRRSPRLAPAMERWWAEYRAGVRRDQLSLTYVAWKEGIRIGSLGRSDPRFGHRIFSFEDHAIGRRYMPALRRRINWLLSRAVPYTALDSPRPAR
jgi:hypothetical protein